MGKGYSVEMPSESKQKMVFGKRSGKKSFNAPEEADAPKPLKKKKGRGAKRRAGMKAMLDKAKK